jgi:protein TonB
MAEASFLERRKVRPGAALTVILMHGAALAALLLAKTEMMDSVGFTPIDLIEIRTPPPPPPPPQPTTEPQPQQRHVIDRFVPPIPSRTNSAAAEDPPERQPDLGARPGGEEVAPYHPPRQPEAAPRPEPVRVAAAMIGNNLQPDYPASEQRAQRPGRVVIRVTVGTDGRVIAAERVSATSDAFWEATVRHARRSWRFRPATVDGRPVEAVRTLTVHFRLEGAA